MYGPSDYGRGTGRGETPHLVMGKVLKLKIMKQKYVRIVAFGKL